MAAIVNQTAYFPREGEVRILQAVFAASPITSFEVGLFASSIDLSTTDSEEVTYAMLTATAITGTGSGAQTITPSATASATNFTVNTPTTGNASVTRTNKVTFSNGGQADWSAPVGGFYVAAVTGTGASSTKKLIMFQKEAASVMTPSSTYEVSLNISLN